MENQERNTIALIGNPNSGKSSIFNHLTGMRQKVSNFPGVTVDKKEAKYSSDSDKSIRIIDFPGAYSLYPNSEDEKQVLNVLSNPEDPDYPALVVYVADANNLEKHMLLLTQILDLGIPAILALNMADLSEGKGVNVDTGKLSKYLGIPVIRTNGRKGENIGALRKAIHTKLTAPLPPPGFYKLNSRESAIAEAVSNVLKEKQSYRHLLIAHHSKDLPFLSNEERKEIQQKLTGQTFGQLDFQVQETMSRYDRFIPEMGKIIAKNKLNGKSTFTDRLDRYLAHKVWGPIIFIAIMMLVFQAIYAWAEMPMEWIEVGIGWLGQEFRVLLPDNWFADFLVDGILAGLGGILVFVPQIAILFFLISILEEVGYMARAVFIFDKIMQHFGLNGRSIVALISGGACAIPAIMSTRTISNFKERLITIMVTPFISCSARIPVYVVLIGLALPATSYWGIFNLRGLAFMGLYLLGIAAALISAWVFKKIVKSNAPSYLMIHLPDYKPPDWKNVWLTVKEKAGAFIWEAGKIILVISMVLWFLASYGPADSLNRAESEAITSAIELELDETATADLIASKKIEASYAGKLGKFIEPAIEPLGFDWKIGIALITSFAAREVFVGTMATIYSIGSDNDEFRISERMANEVNLESGKPVYTMATSFSLLIFYVFAMQCMSTLAIVRRETGTWKWPVIQFVFMSLLAYLASLLTYQMLI